MNNIDPRSIKKVSMRDFYKNMKKYQGLVAAGGSFVVTKNSMPVFMVTAPLVEEQKKYTLADFAQLKFDDGEPDLSQRIDELVYGT